jgi:hypothetical protein
MFKTAVFVSLNLLASLAFIDCQPAQADLDAQTTKISASIFATLTATAPTATPIPSPTPAPTFTPAEVAQMWLEAVAKQDSDQTRNFTCAAQGEKVPPHDRLGSRLSVPGGSVVHSDQKFQGRYFHLGWLSVQVQ